MQPPARASGRSSRAIDDRQRSGRPCSAGGKREPAIALPATAHCADIALGSRPACSPARTARPQPRPSLPAANPELGRTGSGIAAFGAHRVGARQQRRGTMARQSALGKLKDALARVGIKAPWAVSRGAGAGGAGAPTGAAPSAGGGNGGLAALFTSCGFQHHVCATWQLDRLCRSIMSATKPRLRHMHCPQPLPPPCRLAPHSHPCCCAFAHPALLSAALPCSTPARCPAQST